MFVCGSIQQLRITFKTLINNGVHFIGPEEGDMACGEFGFGRMSEPDVIVKSASNILINGPLKVNMLLLHLAQLMNQSTQFVTLQIDHLEIKVVR